MDKGEVIAGVAMAMLQWERRGQLPAMLQCYRSRKLPAKLHQSLYQAHYKLLEAEHMVPWENRVPREWVDQAFLIPTQFVEEWLDKHRNAGERRPMQEVW